MRPALPVVVALVAWATLASGCSAGDPFEPEAGPPAGPPVAGPPGGPSQAEVIAAGVASFRAPGAIQAGASCASCHAPDGYDLAYFDFDDATLRRRAEPHLSAEHADRIVALVHALRRRDGIAPRDHRTARPLQPGGAVLPGATVAERDLAFGRQPRVRALFPRPVLSAAEARDARDRWLAVDVRTLPIGVALNRWSEDPHEGDASIADWLPDLARLPVDDGARTQLHALHDAYLADPSDARLFDVLDATERLTASGYAGNGEQLMAQKYGSVLVAQHLFRREVRTGTPWGDRPSAAWLPGRMATDAGPNPVWMVGDFARVHKKGDVELPAPVVERIGPAFDDEMRRVKTSWFWAGWLFDQGLQRTHGSNSTKFAEYFVDFLRKDFEAQHTPGGTPDASGYAVHAAFVMTKKLTVQNHDPALAAGRRAHELRYSNFHAYGWDVSKEPADPERRALYRALTADSYRTALYLALDHAAAGGVADLERRQWPGPLDAMGRFFEHVASEHLAHDRRLVAAVRATL